MFNLYNDFASVSLIPDILYEEIRPVTTEDRCCYCRNLLSKVGVFFVEPKKHKALLMFVFSPV